MSTFAVKNFTASLQQRKFQFDQDIGWEVGKVWESHTNNGRRIKIKQR